MKFYFRVREVQEGMWGINGVGGALTPGGEHTHTVQVMCCGVVYLGPV